MNGKEFGRKRSWPRRDTVSAFSRGRLKKTTKTVRIAGVPAEIRTESRACSVTEVTKWRIQNIVGIYKYITIIFYVVISKLCNRS
jgi:hypothetical protein